MELPSELCRQPAVCRMALRIFESIVSPIDFKGWGSQCAPKSYGMNKCLSLMHLTMRAMYLIENKHMVARGGVEPPPPAFSGLIY